MGTSRGDAAAGTWIVPGVDETRPFGTRTAEFESGLAARTNARFRYEDGDSESMSLAACVKLIRDQRKREAKAAKQRG